MLVVWHHFVPMNHTVNAGSVVLVTLPAHLRDSLTRDTHLDAQLCLYYFKLTRKPWSVPYYSVIVGGGVKRDELSASACHGLFLLEK
jgi:hypothetical protein